MIKEIKQTIVKMLVFTSLCFIILFILALLNVLNINNKLNIIIAICTTILADLLTEFLTENK